MKNWKLSSKITFVVNGALLVWFVVLSLVVSLKTRSSMEEAATQRLTEATEARAMLIAQYIDSVEQLEEGFAQSEAVRNLLLNPNDTTAYQEAQDYLDSFAAKIDNLEGLYIDDYDSKQLAHSIHDAVGSYGKKEEDREQLHKIVDTMYQEQKGYLAGIIKSPSTGNQVIVNYYPVFDKQGNGIGYTGIAVNAGGLLKILDSLKFQGLEHANYFLLDNKQAKYVFAQDESLINSEIEDEHLKKIISDSASSTEKITRTLGYNDVKSKTYYSAVYQSMPEHGWTFLVSAANHEIFAAAEKLTILVIVMFAGVLLVIFNITYFVVRLQSKELSFVGKTVDELASSMDMTKAEQISKFTDRKDEVGLISHAVYDLAGEISKIIRMMQEKGLHLKDTSSELVGMIMNAKENMSQMDEAVADIAEGATSQAQETESASSNVIAIGTQILQTSDSTKDLMDTSASMRKSSVEVAEVIQRLTEIGTKTSIAVDEIYEQTNMTNQSASKIRAATEPMSFS